MEIGTERKLEFKNRSYNIILLLIALNLYLIDLFIDNGLFYILGHILIIFTLIIFFWKNINQSIKVRKLDNKRERLFDTMKLALKYLKINKNYIIASITGLILATIIVSQTMILSINYEQLAFDNHISDANASAFNFYGFSSETRSIIDDWYEYFKTFEDFLSNNNYILENYIKSVSYFTQFAIGNEQIASKNNESFRYIPNFRLEILEYTIDEYNFYSQFSSFNYDNKTESLLIIPNWFKQLNVEINNTIDIIVGPTKTSNLDEKINYTRITGVNNNFTINEIEKNKFLEDNIDDSKKFEFRLLISSFKIDKLLAIFDEYEINNPSKPIGFNISFQTMTFLKLPNLVEKEIPLLIDDLQRVQREIYSWLENFLTIHRETNIESDSPLIIVLSEYLSDVNSMNSLIYLFSIPLIILALFLVYFSLNIIQQRRRRVIAIMRTRGTSSDQLTILLTEEVLLSGIMAIIVGMILSIPWTSLLLNNNSIIYASFPTEIVWKLPLIGIILTLDITLPSINTLINVKPEEAEIFIERTIPLWQKFHIDLFIFGLSIIFFILIELEIIIDFDIINSLSPVFLFIFMFGAPLVIIRYFASVINIVSELLWRKHKNLITLSAQIIKKNKYSTSKLVTLLFLAIMLTNIAIIMPQSNSNLNIKQVQYNTGADIYISGLDDRNQTIFDINSIPEIVSFTEIITATVYSASVSVPKINILGINPDTFVETAYWDDDFASKPLNELISQLDNNSTLIQEDFQSSADFSIDERITIDLGNFTSKVDYKLQIRDNFKYFPNLVTNTPHIGSNGRIGLSSGQLVLNIDTALNIAGSDAQFGMYIKVNELANITLVVNKLISIMNNSSASISIIDIETQIQELQRSSSTMIMNSFFNSMLVISTLVSSIAILFYSFIIIIDRKRELGVFRSLGMVNKQIFKLLFFESSIILSVSYFLAGLASIFTSNHLFSIYKIIISGDAYSAPDINIYLPFVELILYNLFIFALTILLTVSLSIFISSKQIGSIIRAG